MKPTSLLVALGLSLALASSATLAQASTPNTFYCGGYELNSGQWRMEYSYQSSADACRKMTDAFALNNLIPDSWAAGVFNDSTQKNFTVTCSNGDQYTGWVNGNPWNLFNTANNTPTPRMCLVHLY